jgi:probable rRNA maturation factor
VEVSVAVVDDATIQALNAQYRGQDRPTDVLSFSQDADIRVPGRPRLLGDVVISLHTATRQAGTERSVDDEVCQLAIHGVLHLLGYDDEVTEAYEEMVAKGAAIWSRVIADRG